MRELFREFVIAKHAHERTRRAQLTYVWLTAALQRQKRLPELHDFIAPVRVGPPTRAEQLANLQMMSARYGVPLKKTKLIRVH